MLSRVMKLYDALGKVNLSLKKKSEHEVDFHLMSGIPRKMGLPYDIFLLHD